MVLLEPGQLLSQVASLGVISMSLSLSLGHMFPWAFKPKFLVNSCQTGLYLFCAHGVRFDVLLLKTHLQRLKFYLKRSICIHF